MEVDAQNDAVSCGTEGFVEVRARRCQFDVELSTEGLVGLKEVFADGVVSWVKDW